MTLAAGTRLGPYQVVGPLGAGGMGEVYRARDPRLDRTVAIKVLPSQVATDPALRARFEREARTVAGLSAGLSEGGETECCERRRQWVGAAAGAPPSVRVLPGHQVVAGPL